MGHILDLLAEDYRVQDVVKEHHQYIFLLESPHTDELKFGTPVSGASGRDMTKTIFEGEYTDPLGKLIRSLERGEIHHPLLKQMGLMNVCQIPMQKAAYSLEHQDSHEAFMNILEGLRINYKAKSHQENEWNEVRSIIQQRLDERLKLLVNHKCTIIPCGKFAQTYLERSTIRGKHWTIEKDIPHPSRNQWSNTKVIARIKHIVTEGELINH